MKLFQRNQIKEAYAYADSGETAVHLHDIVFRESPACFVRDVKAGKYIAHVFSQDVELLTELAVRSGIKKVVIDGKGTRRQHVDFCGKPLENLIEEMGEDLSVLKIKALK